MKKNNTNKNRIMIDFDGVLHHIDPANTKGEIREQPVFGSLSVVYKLVEVYELVVLTARKPKDFPAIRKWLDKHGFPKMKITNVKDDALVYIDDKAVQFTTWADISNFIYGNR